LEASIAESANWKLSLAENSKLIHASNAYYLLNRANPNGIHPAASQHVFIVSLGGFEVVRTTGDAGASPITSTQTVKYPEAYDDFNYK
jgi:hypothetical protein